MTKNNNILQEYIELVNLYKQKYTKSIVLFQVGSFYELYSPIENDKELTKVCEILNILLSKKNKNIMKISFSNPHMAGIPCCALEKYLDILINNNYTVIIYNQYNEKNKIKRKLYKIYSIGTYIDSDKLLINDNLILSIYIDFTFSKKINKETFISGISAIDLSTGNIKILEIYNNDYTKLIEDLNKEIIIYNPKEIIFNCNTILQENDYYDKFISFFKNKNTIFHINNIENNFDNINFQKEFFQDIFLNILTNNSLSSIEQLDLEKLTYARISLICLLKFAYSHDNTIINNLNKPEIINNNNFLNLHNNALYQLNILSTHTNYKYNSLFDIINYTSTSMGKRFLKYNLTYPLLDINELNTRYNLITELSNSNIYSKLELELDNVLDIEKYHKKLSLNKLQPFQYGKLNKSYLSIKKIIKLSNKVFNNLNSTIIKDFSNYYDEYIHYFNINNLQLYNLTNNSQNDISNNIFNIGIIDPIDKIYTDINASYNQLELFSNSISSLINNEKIEIKYTDRDGYFLTLTKNRSLKLKKILSSTTVNNQIKELIFINKTQSSCYITSPYIKSLSDKIIKNTNNVTILTNEKFFEISDYLYKKYSKLLHYLNYYISYIDLIKSFTKSSILNNYSKPSIIHNNNSFINCTAIRHPISEKIHSDYNYVTNDIKIGISDNNHKNGYLLYGCNGVGKSTLMKAIGLNIILAQIGCYVAASSFQFYPYNNLFTRIDHSDNLFKGLSSFESEILELKTILNYSNSNSLILGDEILNSTENISAISIISSSINYFLENNISFIFASHLHQIPDYIHEHLKKKLNISYLQIDYDNKSKSFIYNRKLLSGMPIKNYGLIVAKSLLNNDYIINNSLRIQNQIINPNVNNILTNNNIKQSKYNKNILMINCYICNDLNITNNLLNVLETHHIIFQSDYENNICNSKDHIHIKKNQESNLVNLCKYHHIEVHKKNILIDKWVKTSSGKKLQYKIL